MSTTTIEVAAAVAPTTIDYFIKITIDKMTDETLKKILWSSLNKNEKETIDLISALSETEIQKYTSEMLPGDFISYLPRHNISLSRHISSLLEFLILLKNTAVIHSAIRKFQNELSQVTNKAYTNKILALLVQQDENLEAIKILLDCNGDIQFCPQEQYIDNPKDTIFTRAVVSGSKQVVEFLLPKVKLVDDICPVPTGYETLVTSGTKCSSDVNGLRDAAGSGHTEIVEALLQNKASVDLCYWTRNSGIYCEGGTALMAAAQHGHLETIRLLLSYKSNVEQSDIYGETALMLAMGCERDTPHNNTNKHDRLHIIQLLLHAGANVNRISQPIEYEDYRKLPLSPLMCSLWCGFEEACYLILNRGDFVHQPASHGNSILIRRYNYDIPSLIKIELIRLLLDHNFNAHLNNTSFWDALIEHQASITKKLKSIQDDFRQFETEFSYLTNSSSSSSDSDLVSTYNMGCKRYRADLAKEQENQENVCSTINLLQADRDIRAVGLNPIELQRKLLAAFRARFCTTKHELKLQEQSGTYSNFLKLECENKSKNDRDALISLIPFLAQTELLRDPSLLAKLELRLIDSVMPYVFAIRTYEALSHNRTDVAFTAQLPIIFSYISCRNYSLAGPSVFASATTTASTSPATAVTAHLNTSTQNQSAAARVT